MKNIALTMLIIASLCINLSGQQSSEKIRAAVYQGKYLGQELPDSIPKIFAPGLISGKGRMHCFPSFSVDNGEVYWQILPPKIMIIKQINEKWTKPEIADFSNTRNNQAPFIAYDNTIFFSSSRKGGKGGMDIWYMTKKNNKYCEPKNMGAKINSEKYESQPTLSKKRTIFFTGSVQGKLYNKGIFYASYKNGEYIAPKRLPEPINIMNSKVLDYTPFIASDESYLLFCSNRQNPEKELCHIYISYKKDNGEWEEPSDLSRKMGFKESSKFPYVSPDNRFLFFSSGKNIYWLDSKILKLQ